MGTMTIAIGPAKEEEPMKKKGKLTKAMSEEGEESSEEMDEDAPEVSEEEVARAKDFKELTGLDGDPKDIAIALKNFGVACGWGGY